jgi:hypothetical protein
MTKLNDKIVHVAVLMDASSSMQRLASKAIEITDGLIRDLKKTSEDQDLQTRITIYSFANWNDVKCLIFDMDVFRLPSVADLYKVYGNTALIDAVILSQNDLAKTAQMYGEHHFLTYIVTDGQENDSRQGNARDVSRLLAAQGSNWSIAAFVPDTHGQRMMVGCGIPENNIQIWDVSAAGLMETSAKIKETTNTYMTNVSRGVAIDKNNVFGTGVDKVNAATVKANLVPLTKGSYQVWDVTADTRIDLFVQAKGWTFHVGKGYYELTGKSVLVQANKKILVLEKSTGLVYGGAEARNLVGLPQGIDARVKADVNPDYTVLALSTANNRKLLAWTKFVYIA